MTATLAAPPWSPTNQMGETVRTLEQISLANRYHGTEYRNGANMPIMLEGASREQAEKILTDRIEAGIEKYGGECSRSRLWEENGWLYSEAYYKTKASPAAYRVLIYPNGSVAAI